MTGDGGTDVGKPPDEDIYMDDDRYPNEDPGNDPALMTLPHRKMAESDCGSSY